MGPAKVVLLGPQRLSPTVGEAVASLAEIDAQHAQLAAVTAGWEELEKEDGELSDHLHGKVINLSLYERTEDVFRRDPDLFQAMRTRHDRMRRLQSLYRLRLSHALEAARQILRHPDREGESEFLAGEQEEAIQVVRRLDAHHLRRVTEIHAEFDAEWRPEKRKAVSAHRKELKKLIGKTAAVCVAGGHVAILLNRMRVFGLPELIGDRPVVCWSAGAMALSERIIVFHDSPPQGPGNAEILEAGLGVFRGIVPLPHAKRRLRLEDPVRVGLFARRFGPSICVALDENTRIEGSGESWTAQEGTLRLTEEGRLEGIKAV